MSKAIQKFTISAVDPKELIRLVLEYGKKGAWLPDDEYPQLNHYPKHVKLAIEVVDGVGIVEKTPNIIAFDPIYDAKSFSKEELDSMEWDALKKICKEVGLSHRDRAQLIRKYLDFVGEDIVTSETDNVQKPKTPRKNSKPSEEKPSE